MNETNLLSEEKRKQDQQEAALAAAAAQAQRQIRYTTPYKPAPAAPAQPKIAWWRRLFRRS